MGNTGSSPRHKHGQTHGHPHPAPMRHYSDPLAQQPASSDQEEGSGMHAPVQRSSSVPVRTRLESVGSYNSSMEGAYTDLYDGMTPLTFGGDYHKDIPRKCHAENFDAVHGNKLKIPFDSKYGSGFDLDWQYDKKKRDRVAAKHSLSPDHPLYHKLTPKIVEVVEDVPVQRGRHTQV